MRLNHQVFDTEKGSINLLLPQSFVFGVLASIYVLAFIVSPYWLIPESTGGKAGMLILTLFLGGLWCYFSAEELDLKIDIRRLWTIIPLTLGIIIMNFQALKYDIPSRGDEQFHIAKTLWVIDKITPAWTAVYYIFPMVLAFFLFVAWKFPRRAGVWGGLILSIIVFLVASKNIFIHGADFFLRYPFVNYILFSVIPILVSPKFPYHEILFRAFPFISTIGIVWITTIKLDIPDRITTFLWGIAVATIPSVFYYSSILYLELPAVLLMLMVAFDIRNLLTGHFDLIQKTTGWFALILIGFIKETAVGFLVCFLFCRWMIFVFRAVTDNRLRDKISVGLFLTRLGRELILAICVLAPLAFYLTLRTNLGDVRSLDGDVSNLLKFYAYPALVKSFVEQFGAFFFLFLAGWVLLIVRKEYPTAFFYLFTFIAIPLFHVTDNIAYTGYSRFNLFILPVTIAGGAIATKLLRRKKILAIIVPGIVILSNILTSPVFPDGSKQVYWGNYLVDTSEHYYPYQQALTWLKKNNYDSKILFICGDYAYYFEYYFNQLDWHPAAEVLDDNQLDGRGENALIIEYLDKAKKESFDAVLYQVIETQTMPPVKVGFYHLEKILINDAGQRLIIYVR